MTRHYPALDGLRGIAALAVVAFHIKNLLGPFRPASAYLAVDFFFVLSGFVIAHAYDGMIGDARGWRIFVVKRIARLYPLYAAGAAIAAIAAAAAVFGFHDAAFWTGDTLAVAALCAAFVLPSPLPGHLFPLNAASWSLCFEFVANFVYATGILRKGYRVWLVMGLAALGLVAEVVLCGSLDNGAEWRRPWWSSLAWGGVRVAYSFPLGLLLYRHGAALAIPRLDMVVLLPALAVLLWIDPAGPYRMIFDLGFVLVISPAIVLCGAGVRVASSASSALCGFLGSISYPIYALHLPMTQVMTGIGRRLFHSAGNPHWLPAAGIALFVGLISISALADRLERLVRYGLLQTPLRP